MPKPFILGDPIAKLKIGLFAAMPAIASVALLLGNLHLCQ